MANSSYITGRQRYARPQAMLWSENSGTLSNGIYVPNGYEVGANTESVTDTNLLNQFIILSDHNRSEISMQPQRIEQRQRTINGRMRSYYVADKLNISVSWTMLPSRAFNVSPDFNESGANINATSEYTADGGAGGVEILDWYKNHKGSFWVYLAYDKYSNFTDGETSKFSHLAEYNEVIEVYFSNFNYNIIKRGGTNHDLWNISVTLEEA